MRLSNGSGTPYFPDRTSDVKGSVLGLAVRFELASGGHSAWASLNISTFPASKPDEFIGLSSARRKGLPTGLPNPLRFVIFLVSHPKTLPGVKATSALGPHRASRPSASTGCTPVTPSTWTAPARRFATAGFPRRGAPA